MSHQNCRKKVLLHSRVIFQKVLIAIQTLIDIKGKFPELEDIHEYMIHNYCIEGDLYSQILNALDRGERYGFLHKKKNKYYLVCPAATILRQNKPKMFEMERIRSIFHSKESGTKNRICKRAKSQTQCRNNRRAVSCGDIKDKGDCAETDEKNKKEPSQAKFQDNNSNKTG
ncbi:uncharacterized protein LOC123670943 isoform X2 [Harmonia axyridis]|uniref:uncharacterized protein LOC123670943 isoform X2 n=1 Tax=Harmonia axyridis TaxID=115357 RepID=UPI001E274E0E|nr:uncharacterized protein LOC123670943 isoform X2 [Harmonia axyridis]